MKVSRTSRCALALLALGLVASSACGSNDNPTNPPCPITYPASGFYGDNVFFPGAMAFQSDVTYELDADIFENNTLSFTMTGTPDAVSTWYTDSTGDFRYTTPDATTGQQRFMSRLIGLNETKVVFMGTGQARIDFYECGATDSTRVETITWQP